MNMLTRQQLCAALIISEATVRRLELSGLPCTPVGVRSKRYDLAEVKQWLRMTKHPSAAPQAARSSNGQEFSVAARKVRLRVYPSTG